MQEILHYKEFGQGPPLVILHGLFGMLDNWQTIAKRLAKHYTVFILDQRNHGKSFHQSPHTYEAMANDLEEFLESRWIYKTHLMGHSMGGKTAMKFAVDYPDFIDKLIVVDIAPKQYPPGHQVIFEALASIDLHQIKSRKEAEDILKQKIGLASIRQFLLKNLTRNKNGGFRWKMNLPVIEQYYPEILAPCLQEEDVFEGETLFLKGERSPYITNSDEKNIFQHFPNAHIKTIPEAGHWLHAEAPEEVLKVVLSFLAQ